MRKKSGIDDSNDVLFTLFWFRGVNRCEIDYTLIVDEAVDELMADRSI